MRRADRHLKNGILAGQTATRSGLSGNGPDRFLLSGAPADNDPPLPNGARDRSLAVTATDSLPADTMQTRRPKHGKRIKMANNRRHSHRELIRSPTVIRGCRPRSSIPTPTLTGKLVRRQNPTTDTIRRKSDTEIKRQRPQRIPAVRNFRIGRTIRRNFFQNFAPFDDHRFGIGACPGTTTGIPAQ